MDNLIQDEAGTEELKHGVPPDVETTEGTNLSLKDPDIMLSMTVLLLACLALAALAHMFV